MTDLPIVVTWGLKATPLLLAAWIVTGVLRRAGAATRHFVWVLALAGALALPLATLVAPRVAVPLPFAQAPTTTIAGVVTTANSDLAATLDAGDPARTAAPARPTVSADAPALRALSPTETIVAIWAIGAVVILLLVARSVWRTTGLARGARPLAHAGVLRDLHDAAARLGIRRPVRLLQSNDASMPMTWGARRPTVLVPSDFVAWPPSRRQAVLVHELAHVRRCDWATQLGARVACALYWWHPLVWLAARRLRDERELACDDLVLAHGAAPSAYAGDLLEIARALRACPATALAAVAMARRSELAGRLLAVLDAARSRRTLGTGQAWSASAAAAVLLLPLAGLGSAVAPPTAPASGAGPTVWSATVVDLDAPRAPADPPPAPQGRSAMLCDWSARRGSSSSSMSVNDDRMMVQISHDDCTITARAEGDLRFTDDDRDLRQLDRGGSFEIEERSGRTRRRVEISDADGGLDRRWFVDGREQPYGAEARAWLGDALLVLMRRAGINAEARAVRILETQGEEALIAEIALLQSDHVAGKYYRVLFERGTLTSEQTARLLTDAAARIDSDHELGRVLATVAARGPMDGRVQQAYVQATGAIDSDHTHGQALQALIGAGSLDTDALDAVLVSATRIASDHSRAGVLLMVGERYPAGRLLPASYLEAVSTMNSDHERGRVLTQLLGRDRLSAADRARVLRVVSRIDSDHTQSQILLSVVEQAPLDDATRDAFFAAVRDVDSDYSRQRVLTAVAGASTDEATTLAVLDAARDIGSDHSKTQVLTAIAERGPLSDRVRTAYAAVAQTIGSRANRERAMRAAGLQGI